jgi:putative ABC transport system permease protein
VLAVQALEYAFLSVILSVLALLLGLGGAWYVVTQLFTFEWLPDYATVFSTLVGGAGLTMAIGLIGAWPILSARPARALRDL